MRAITTLFTFVWFWATVVLARPLPRTSDLIEARYNRLRGRQSGLQFSESPADWPSRQQLRSALRSQPNKVFFWTGTVLNESAEVVAFRKAAAVGGLTLEGGLAAANLRMPRGTTPEATKIWKTASATLARQASGEAFVVKGIPRRLENVFDTTELSALKRNKRVTKVTRIDGATDRRTTIFDRNKQKTDAVAQENAARGGACGTPPPSPIRTTPPPLPKRDTKEATLEKRQATGPAARGRKKTGAAPACPLPGAPAKKVVPRSATVPKPPTQRRNPKTKPAARPPAPKRQMARPPNRPKRAKGTAAPPRKRTTPVKKPKIVPKPPAKQRGGARRRRR